MPSATFTCADSLLETRVKPAVWSWRSETLVEAGLALGLTLAAIEVADLRLASFASSTPLAEDSNVDPLREVTEGSAP